MERFLPQVGQAKIAVLLFPTFPVIQISMLEGCCSTKSDTSHASSRSHSTPAPPSPCWVNPLTASSIVNVRESEERDMLPSLCEQVEEPEAHPDFEAVMASLKHRTPLFSIQVNRLPSSSTRPSPAVSSPRPLPSVEKAQSTLQYYSTRNLALATPPRPSSDGTSRPVRPRPVGHRKSSLFDVSSPRPAVMYAAAEYNVTAARYVTNADPRGFLPGKYLSKSCRLQD
jgi:hypothetical protein